jgi:hypothetical protein
MRDERGLAVGAADGGGGGRRSGVEVGSELGRRGVGQRQAERDVVLVAAHDPSEIQLKKKTQEKSLKRLIFLRRSQLECILTTISIAIEPKKVTNGPPIATNLNFFS